MKVSIVIATYNRQAILARTLPTVLDQDFPADQREVIVVIDGSTDATVHYLQTVQSPCRLVILQRPHGGAAAARNAGILAASGELMVLLDDDMLCERSLISGHVAAHERTPGALVFGPIFVAAESERSVAVDWLNLHGDRNTVGSNAAPRSKYRAWATNCSIRRSVLIAQGGYDEHLLTHEDADLGIRLWEAGVRFQFEPTLAISELYDKTPRRLAGLEARQLGRNKVLLCRKHPGYRPHSRQAHLRGSTLGSMLIWLACRLPVSPEPLLRPFQFVAERSLPARQAQSLAMQLFRCRLAIEEVRGTLEESGSWRAFHRGFGIRLRVLRYSLADPNHVGDRKLTISAARFDRHLHWLRRCGYSPIKPSQWRAWIEEGGELPSKPVLITFDNSYAWLEEHALAILRRTGFGAVAFTLDGGAGDEGAAGADLMTTEQRSRWVRAGMDLGVRLPAYVSRLSAVEMRQELIRRKGNLENSLGGPIDSFSYPGGFYDDALRSSAEGLFETAFTCEPGLNALHTDLLRLCTTAIAPHTGLAGVALSVMLGRRPAQLLVRQNRGDYKVVEQSRVFCRSDEFPQAAPRGTVVSPVRPTGTRLVNSSDAAN